MSFGDDTLDDSRGTIQLLRSDLQAARNRIRELEAEVSNVKHAFTQYEKGASAALVAAELKATRFCEKAGELERHLTATREEMRDLSRENQVAFSSCAELRDRLRMIGDVEKQLSKQLERSERIVALLHRAIENKALLE